MSSIVVERRVIIHSWKEFVSGWSPSQLTGATFQTTSNSGHWNKTCSSDSSSCPHLLHISSMSTPLFFTALLVGSHPWKYFHPKCFSLFLMGSFHSLFHIFFWFSLVLLDSAFSFLPAFLSWTALYADLTENFPFFSNFQTILSWLPHKLRGNWTTCWASCGISISWSLSSIFLFLCQLVQPQNLEYSLQVSYFGVWYQLCFGSNCPPRCWLNSHLPPAISSLLAQHP